MHSTEYIECTAESELLASPSVSEESGAYRKIEIAPRVSSPKLLGPRATDQRIRIRCNTTLSSAEGTVEHMHSFIRKTNAIRCE